MFVQGLVLDDFCGAQLSDICFLVLSGKVLKNPAKIRLSLSLSQFK